MKADVTTPEFTKTDVTLLEFTEWYNLTEIWKQINPTAIYESW